jgi:hypothetical protein
MVRSEPSAEASFPEGMGVGVVSPRLRLTLLGVGAMNSPRYPPAGLLVRYRRCQVMVDGGPGAEPAGRLAAWLVTDEHSELRASCVRWPPPMDCTRALPRSASPIW